MKNYAKINSENIVDSVIVSTESYLKELNGTFVEITDATGWAGPGSLYSSTQEKFLGIKPFESWLLNEEDFEWEAPKPKPATGKWVWEESEQEWVEVVSAPAE